MTAPTVETPEPGPFALYLALIDRMDAHLREFAGQEAQE